MRLQVGKSYYTRRSSRVIGPMEEDSRTGLFYAPSLGEFNSNIGTNFMNYKPNRWFPTGAISPSAANPFDLVDVVPDPLYIWANEYEGMGWSDGYSIHKDRVIAANLLISGGKTVRYRLVHDPE